MADPDPIGAVRPPLVVAEAVQKYFPLRGGLFARAAGSYLRGVDGVSFEIPRGASLGIAGESGCGKTTLARLLLRLLTPTAGRVLFGGVDLSTLGGADLLAFRRQAQLMVQNPYEAINPRFTIGRALAEPLIIHNIGTKEDRLDRVVEALTQVNLHPADAFLDQFPHQLSGGQLQRVGLARALMVDPLFLVADEPVSMLDVSVRAGVLNLMRTIARSRQLTTVYISHDLSLVRYVCDTSMIMYLGSVAEIGPTDAVLAHPKHPYTQLLVAAAPVPDPTHPAAEIAAPEQVPTPIGPGRGCPFKDRCPQVMPVCHTTVPPLSFVGPNHQAACHLYGPLH
ncbi:MAG: ATP-binding cassette domain-containing protein [Bacillati bacterium ANGP1]|uniref:ATP-binding cassette domain-containing protein n=1 Tax=Candidatus Segetimicrobium genomatis TaxID=2569760 RepID=A0A537JNG4_9BACT|nr:MAG: ATP-binding cassette domain-containing protein [Terrabacteria group bacterium ANGP1]